MRQVLRVLGVLVFFSLCSVAAFASITRDNQWTGGNHSTSCASGCTFSVTVSPSPGNVEVMTVYEYNSAAAPSTGVFSDNQSGSWTSYNSTLGVKQNTFVAWHIAAAGDTSYKFTPTVASGTTYVGIAIAEYTSVNTSAPFDVTPIFGTPGPGTSPTPPPLTTLQANDMAVVGFGNGSQAETGMSAGWGVVNGGSGTNVYMTLADALQGAAGAVTVPAITYAAAPSNPQTFSAALAPAPAVSGAPSLLAVTGAGGPHMSQTVPTPTPAAPGTPPPPTNYVFFNSFGMNQTVTAAQAQQYFQWCEGTGTTSGGATPGNCQQHGGYWSLNLGQINNTSGNDNSQPFQHGESGSGCEEPPGPFWASAVPGYTDPNVATNWLVYPSVTGSTPGSAQWAVASFYHAGGSTPATAEAFLIPLNLKSTTYQNYVNNYIADCGTHNSETFGRDDNWFSGLASASNGWWIAGSHGYPVGINYGNADGTPYASLNCNTGFAGSFTGGSNWCTTPTFNGGANFPTLTYTSDLDWITSECGMFDALHHKNGSAFMFWFNGQHNTELSQMTCAHVIGGQSEKMMVSFPQGCTTTSNVGGTSPNYTNPCENGFLGNTPSPMAIALDICSATAQGAPGKDYDLEDTSPSSGNYALGTANHQWNRRAHIAGIWLCESDTYPGMMTSETEFCANLSGCIEIWPENFIQPYGRITPYPANPTPANCGSVSYGNYLGTGVPCTAGGGHDASIIVSGTSGYARVYRVEWKHLYYQSTPDLTKWPGSAVYAGTNTVADLGPSCEIYNNTASAVQITSTLVSTWCSNTFSTLTSVLALCTPSGYFNTSGSGAIYTVGATNVCSGNSGSWVGIGAFDFSQPLTGIYNEYLPSGDMLMLTS